jgi:hypothetical protein
MFLKPYFALLELQKEKDPLFLEDLIPSLAQNIDTGELFN